MDNTKIVVSALAVLLGVLAYRALHPSTKLAADGSDRAWDAAVELSHESGQPAVVLFTADWCPACQSLHRSVLSDDDVHHELNAHYIFYSVDLTNPSAPVAAHAREFGATAIPLLIRYDKNGNETGRANYLNREQMIAWLKAGE
jgi:thioredoxin